MLDNYRKTRLKREDSLLEEAIDREGDWLREFSSRSIIWPVFEHWAAENGYRLIALRNKRRLYQFGRDKSQFITFVDVKQDGTHVRFKAWTRASWLARVFRLFLLPAKMSIDPQGFLAIRYRRKVCHQLNSLLERLGQPPILFSQNFHWADLDLTTIALIPLVIAPTAAFTYVCVPPLQSILYQFDNETLQLMLFTLGVRLSVISLLALTLVGVHHWVVVRRLNFWLAKIGSVVVAGLIVTFTAMGLRPGTDPAALKKQATVHCLYEFEQESCQKALNGLDLGERLALKRELKLFYKELSVMDRRQNTPLHRTPSR